VWVAQSGRLLGFSRGTAARWVQCGVRAISLRAPIRENCLVAEVDLSSDQTKHRTVICWLVFQVTLVV
jgi:hypothetical protein